MRRTLIALSLALPGCSSRETVPANLPVADLVFTVRDDSVTGPDTTEAGWKRLRVEEDGAGHILVVFRLEESVTNEGIGAYLATLDSAPATPAGAVALGGPEVGDSGEVVIQFPAGRYLLGCVRRGPGGHRHLHTGEAKLVIVTPAAGGVEQPPPTATQDVEMVDFAYVGPDHWRAGSHMIRVSSRGQQDHQLRLARLEPDVSIQDWIESEGDLATTITGVARMGPGTVAYLPVELPAGGYVVYCLVTDPASGRAHIEMGMFRAIQVE